MGKLTGVVVGLYFVIMVECTAMGVALYYAIYYAARDIGKPAAERLPEFVILFTFLVVAILGHICILPCVCYSVQRHKAKWLIPYLVWRMVLSFLVAALAAYLCATLPEQRDTSQVYDQVIPPAATEIVLGFALFGIAFRAHREFLRRRIERVEELY